MDPENPPLVGERNPYGDWEKIRTRQLLKRYGCREKAPAFCPPHPDYVLVGAFNDVAKDKDTKMPYKRCHDNMQVIGGAAHAMLASMSPIFNLREQLAHMEREVERGVFPFHATVGPGSFLQWIRDTAYDISHTVFRGVKDAAVLSAAGFNEQIKTIRKMVVDHPRTESLPISIDRCAPSEEFFCGGHDDYLKDQIKASRLTDPYFMMAMPTSGRFSTPKSAFSRGKGQTKGKTPYSGVRSTYRRPASRPTFKSSFKGSRPSTSKTSGNAPKRPSRGGRGAKRY